jgi:hypothetical protein
MDSLYQPLDTKWKQIRLAVLHPSEDLSARVQCSLRTTSLLLRPHHEALSYVWGDAQDTRQLSLNGFSVAVTANLDAALRTFRMLAQGKPIVLWIDAICINQADDTERSHQVSMMREIYTAAQVRVWPGFPRSVQVARGFRRLARIMRMNAKTYDDAMKYDEDIDGTEGVRGVGFGTVLKHKYYSSSIFWFKDELEALESVFSLPYWTRRWVIQETVFAEAITFQYGYLNFSIDCWARLEDLSKLLISTEGVRDAIIGTHKQSDISRIYLGTKGECRLAIERSIRTFVEAQKLWVFKKDVHAYGSDPGCDWSLLYLRSAKQTDDRDALYAMLGLLTAELRVMPDYRKNVNDIFEEFAWDFISRTQSLALISTASTSHSDLPS